MNVHKKTRLKEGEVVANRYRIEGVVGLGGFGAVYKARHLSAGNLVALKILLANYSTSETDSKRFEREAALVKKLEHPNVVRMLDFGSTERGVPFIAFELLRGRALHNVIKEQGALSLYRGAEIGRDVLLALEAAHALGIVHRDIKPQNIFLNDDRSLGAKVLDFGVAKALRGEESKATQLTAAGQMIGTPHYMSPEQVRGISVTPTTDLYALGLVLAEMVSGERVVKGEALIEVYMTHIADRPLELPARAASTVLAPIIRKAIAKQAGERYESATEMRVALESAVGLSTANPQALPTHQMPEISDKPAPLLLDSIETLEMVPGPRQEPTTSPSTSATVVMEAAEYEAQQDAIAKGIAARQAEAASRIMDDLASTAYLDDSEQPWLQADQAAAAAAPPPAGAGTGAGGGAAPMNQAEYSGGYPPVEALAVPSAVGTGPHAVPSAVGTGPHAVISSSPRQPPQRSKRRGATAFIVVTIALLAAAITVLLLWQPWQASP